MSVTNIKRKFFSAGFIAALLCAASCNIEPTEPQLPPLPPVWIAVATASADYSASNFELILLDDYSVIENIIPNLHTDIAMRSFDGAAYILERRGKDNVIKYSGDIVIEYQQSLGVGLNIQDIAFVSQTKAYISALEDYNIIVFDPQAGTVLSHIDLSRFNSFAGEENEAPYPFVSSLAVRGNYLYAACQRLDPITWGIGDVSVIAIINTQTDEIAGHIELNKKNPASMSIFENFMLVSSQGGWMDEGYENAGIEKIDLETNVNLGVIIDGNALGGNPTDIIFISQNSAYVVVGGDWTTPARVVPFDPSTGTVGAKINGIANASGGIAFDKERLYIGDRGFENFGVAVVDTFSNDVLLTIQTNMPPEALAVIFAE